MISKVDITEAIMHFPNFFNPEVGKYCIDFCNHRASQSQKLSIMADSDKVNTEVRDVNGYPLCGDKPSDIFTFHRIKKEIERMVFNYKAKFPAVEYNGVLQIDLLHYKKSGKYKMHVDLYRRSNRNLSCIINLNEDYEGGDLCFGDPKCNIVKRYKLKKNDIIFFPSNFLYPHCIEPITKGERYSIVAWLD